MSITKNSIVSRITGLDKLKGATLSDIARR